MLDNKVEHYKITDIIFIGLILMSLLGINKVNAENIWKNCSATMVWHDYFGNEIGTVKCSGHAHCTAYMEKDLDYETNLKYSQGKCPDGYIQSGVSFSAGSSSSTKTLGIIPSCNGEERIYNIYMACQPATGSINWDVNINFRSPQGDVITQKTCKFTEGKCFYTEDYTCGYNYVFKGWNMDKNATSGKYAIGVETDDGGGTLDYYAICQLIKSNPTPPSSGYDQEATPSTPQATTPDPESTEEPAVVCPKSNNTTKATVINNYKITYNLNGGHFMDGSTSRTEIVASNVSVGSMKLNPLKEGYKFISWQDSTGTEFDFNSKLTSDITLTAYYEELEEDYYNEYSCPDNSYILDPSTNACYKVLKFDSNGEAKNIYSTPYGQDNATPTKTTAYNYTKYSYEDNQRYCWGWNSPNEGDLGSINFSNYTPKTTIGKNNSKYYYEDNGNFVAYEQDWWKSIDSCNLGKSCEALPCTSETNYKACDIQYSAIIYKKYNAIYNPITQENINNDNEDHNTSPNPDSNKLNNDNIINVNTGSLSLALIITLSIISLLSAIYFYKKKKA